jgi:hypothetical protein
MAKSVTRTAQRTSRPPSRKPWWKNWTLWAIVAGVLVIALIGGAIVLQLNSTGGIQGVQYYAGLTRVHTTEPVAYAQTPPVGGAHDPTPQNCGIYDAPIRNENGVHSLEHGAVWITYQPSLPSSAVDELRQLVRGHSHLLLSPYDGLPAPVVASAWGLQLQAQAASDERIARFIKQYEQGPQTPEPGAACSGGVGNPIG